MDNRISRLSVRDLFGVYHYDLPIESEIMLFHALNGCGKTTMMKLIRAIIVTDTAWIHDVIFREFTVSFSNGSSISVRKEIQSVLNLDKEIGRLRLADMSVGYEPGDGVRDFSEDQHPMIRTQIRQAEKDREDAFADQHGEYVFVLPSGEEHHVRVAFNQISSEEQEQLSGLTKACTDGLQVHYVSAGRLYSVDGNEDSLCDATSFYIAKVSDMINKAMHEPRPFFIGIQRAMAEFGMSIDDIVHYEHHEMDIDPVYELYKKVKALQKYLDQTFELPNKKMHMSYADHEIYFMTDGGGYVPATALSSGEKNLLVLLIYLIFCCGEGSVVLLDEPEISMHISWQMNFVDAVMEIMEENGFQVIIPTHSPSVINDHWDVTIGLGEDEDDE